MLRFHCFWGVVAGLNWWCCEPNSNDDRPAFGGIISDLGFRNSSFPCLLVFEKAGAAAGIRGREASGDALSDPYISERI